MRIQHFLMVGGAVLSAALVFGQTLPPALPGPLPKIGLVSKRSGPGEAETRRFEFDGQKYLAILPHQKILSGQPWKPDLPLPLSFTKVEEIARQEFRKLGVEDEALQLTGFQVQRLLETPEDGWYYAVTFRSMLDIFADPGDRITFLVTLDGHPAKLARTR